MKSSKYVKPLLISIIIVFGIAIPIAAALSAGNSNNAFRVVPPVGGGFPAIYMFLMYIVAPILGALIGGYLLSPLFLWVHKNTIGRKMVYGVQDKPQPDKFKLTFRGFFPALMAINFALMFGSNEVIQELMINTAVANDAAMRMIMIITLFPLCMFTIGITAGLFAPVWFLLDSGVVYSNKEKIKDTALPDEVRSVGGWYIYLLKGYAGISVIFAYYTFISSAYAAGGMEGPAIALLPILPILLTIALIPTIVIFDIMSQKKKVYVLKWAKKFGIVDTVDVKFEKVQKAQ